jgi:soluble lytic murein transglycosylase-like protein
MTNDYDPLIKTSATRYLDDTDWRLVKAQLFQESRLSPTAVSKAGAQGLSQFMPGTWRDMMHKMRMPANARPFDPEYAIPALCFYMAELHGQWTAKREPADRYALALASYNAGIGNIIKAQKLAQKKYGTDEANAYHCIISMLHLVTGYGNSRETRDYVEKIFHHFTAQIIKGI